MKTAFYNKRFNTLTLWVQRNVSETVSCYSAKSAKAKVLASGIEQIIKTV